MGLTLTRLTKEMLPNIVLVNFPYSTIKGGEGEWERVEFNVV